MSKAIYIATTGPHSGKSLISIGLMHTLLWNAAKVGYFRPIIDDTDSGDQDNHLQTMLSAFELDLEYADAHVCTRSECLQLLNDGEEDILISRIIEKYKSIEANYDFIIVEGSDFSGVSNIAEWDINVMIAQNLSIPVIIIANGSDRSVTDITSNLKMAYDSFAQKGVEVLMLVANKINKRDKEAIEIILEEALEKEVLIAGIPLDVKLNKPSIKEIVSAIDGEILFGDDQLNNPVGSFTVGAMSLSNYLPHIQEQGLVMTPGDRSDIILGALQANISDNYPNISGIVLTGGLRPAASVNRLIDGLTTQVPIIAALAGTFAAANTVGNVQSQIYAGHKDKIRISIDTFEKYVAEETLLDRLASFESVGISPRMFQYNLLKRAQADRKHIVLPEGMDKRILRAASELINTNAVDLTLLGDKKQIRNQLNKHNINLDLEKVFIVNPIESPYFDEYVNKLYELRKHKKLSKTIARDLMQDVSYFGTMMVHQGHADGMVSGAIHSTQHTIRPALQFIKTVPGISVASSVFFMCLEDRVTIYGDCAINANPTAEQLSEIAIASADTSIAFGMEPKIAMLSYSSGTSGKGEDVDTVRAATTIVKSKRPELIIEGPIQYDAAVDPAVGKIKLPESQVAGEANVFIFPDLNSGNNTYKAVQRETNTLAIGPIIQGLNKPINDLSRGCTVEDIINTVIVTAIQAQLN